MKMRTLPIFVMGMFVTACVTEGPNKAQLQISDNLSTKTEIVSPSGQTIIKTLKEFEAAYEAGDTQKLRKVLHADFKKLQLRENEVLNSEKRGEFIRTVGRPLDVSLSHLKRTDTSDTIFAVAAVGQKGKYFTNRTLDVFLFDKSNLGQIKGIMSSPIYYDAYPTNNVSIFFGENFSTQGIQKALDSKNVDKAMDELVKGKLTSFTPRQDLSSLVVSPVPPKPGSTVKTEYFLQSSGQSSASFKFEHKLKSSGPYVALTDYIVTHSNAGSITLEVYVNDNLIGEASIN